MKINSEKPDVRRIFAENLKLARTMRGFSMKALSKKMSPSVTPAALSYYESGQRFPGSRHLIAIAKALGVSPDYLMNPVVAPLDESTLSFRRLSSTPKRDRDAIAAQAQDALRRVRESMILSGGGIPTVSPVESVVIADGKSADRAALVLRKAWDLGVDPIMDVVDLLERNGLVVLSLDMPRGVSGFCGDWNDIRFVACNASNSPFRRRSTLLHEVAHLLFGCDDERLAQRFAGAFLLPRESFEEVWGRFRRRCPSDGELLIMKNMFGASMSSIVMRAVQLGFLSESQKKGYFISHPRNWQEPGDDSAEFREKPSLFRSRVFGLLQEERITLTKGAALLAESVERVRLGLAAK
ncbi:MAG: ImmA/IrrE family metallo-endopeptidase [Kiritimatiellae bacterium]|nr:ImmA/IrrE family metallo-endopeptidase [Kiritimatiellia bacterium]